MWAGALKRCVIEGDSEDLDDCFSTPSTDLFCIWLAKQKISNVYKKYRNEKGLLKKQPGMSLYDFLDLNKINEQDWLSEVLCIDPTSSDVQKRERMSLVT